jgi:hypothetical protein
MLLTALTCSIQALRNAKLHAWMPRAGCIDNSNQLEQKFTVNFGSNLPSNWPLRDALVVFNNARIEKQDFHSEILSSKPGHLMFCRSFEEC